MHLSFKVGPNDRLRALGLRMLRIVTDCPHPDRSNSTIGLAEARQVEQNVSIEQINRQNVLDWREVSVRFLPGLPKSRRVSCIYMSDKALQIVCNSAARSDSGRWVILSGRIGRQQRVASGGILLIPVALRL